MNFEEAEEIVIKMIRSPELDGVKGKFYPKGIWVILDGVEYPFIKGIKLTAHVDESTEVSISYMPVDKDGNPLHDVKDGFIERLWEHSSLEDDIELIEDDK